MKDRTIIVLSSKETNKKSVQNDKEWGHMEFKQFQAPVKYSVLLAGPIQKLKKERDGEDFEESPRHHLHAKLMLMVQKSSEKTRGWCGES